MNRPFLMRIQMLLLVGVPLLAGTALFAEDAGATNQSEVSATAELTSEETFQAVRKLGSEIPNHVAVPESWEGTRKYFYGYNVHLSCSFHRVVVEASSYRQRDDVPPTNAVPYSTFYFDRAGRLQLIVANDGQGEPYVATRMLYHGEEPMANIGYTREGWSLIDYVHYQKGSPVRACRLLRSGEIVLVENLDAEDADTGVFFSLVDDDVTLQVRNLKPDGKFGSPRAFRLASYGDRAQEIHYQKPELTVLDSSGQVIFTEVLQTLWPESKRYRAGLENRIVFVVTREGAFPVPAEFGVTGWRVHIPEVTAKFDHEAARRKLIQTGALK